MANETFTVDEFHLALLKRINFTEGQYAPEVDPKRPYGNKDVLGDLQEIYGETKGYEIIRIEDGGVLILEGDRVVARGDGTEAYDGDIQRILHRYHNQMATVLQIPAYNLSIEVGTYERIEPYGRRWALVSKQD